MLLKGVILTYIDVYYITKPLYLSFKQGKYNPNLRLNDYKDMKYLSFTLQKLTDITKN